MGQKPFGRRMLVRTHYKKLWGIMQSRWEQQQDSAFVLWGTPGTMKSFMAFYCMERIAQLRSHLVYEYKVLGGRAACYMDFRGTTPRVLLSMNLSLFQGKCLLHSQH